MIIQLEQTFVKNWKMMLCLFIFFALSACARTPLATRASRVRLLSAEQAHFVEERCEFLGNVVGTSYWTLSRDIAHSNALHELMDNAAELGATHVFVNEGDFRNLRGEAFFCAFCRMPNGYADESQCLDDGQKVPIDDQETCELKGYYWNERATDKIGCEAKGGIWVLDKDILRLMYRKGKSKGK